MQCGHSPVLLPWHEPKSKIKVTHRSYEETQIHRSIQQCCWATRREHKTSLIKEPLKTILLPLHTHLKPKAQGWEERPWSQQRRVWFWLQWRWLHENVKEDHTVSLISGDKYTPATVMLTTMRTSRLCFYYYFFCFFLEFEFQTLPKISRPHFFLPFKFQVWYDYRVLSKLCLKSMSFAAMLSVVFPSKSSSWLTTTHWFQTQFAQDSTAISSLKFESYEEQWSVHFWTKFEIQNSKYFSLHKWDVHIVVGMAATQSKFEPAIENVLQMDVW